MDGQFPSRLTEEFESASVNASRNKRSLNNKLNAKLAIEVPK